MPPAKKSSLVPYVLPPDMPEHEPPAEIPMSPEDTARSPWELSARMVVQETLREATWDPWAGTVTLPSYDDGSKHPQHVPCGTLEHLVDELEVRAETAWCGAVPGEGSSPLFDFPGSILVEDVLNEFRSELATMRWKL